ncbi:MAG: hypothetical protein K0R61_3672 [Microvirga sp.]|jgi:hypothetical protein|nr:hypothetical protein [Microvirga sp.]
MSDLLLMAIICAPIVVYPGWLCWRAAQLRQRDVEIWRLRHEVNALRLQVEGTDDAQAR